MVRTIDVQTEMAVAASMVFHGTLVAEVTPDTRVGVDGRYYSQHGLGASLLLVPAVLLTGGAHTDRSDFLAMVIEVLFATTSVVLLFAFLVDIGISPPAAVVTSLLFAFATLEWAYAHDVFDVVPTQALAFGATLLARRRAAGGAAGYAVGSGVLVALSVLVRSSSVVIAALLLTYVAWQRRGAGARGVVAEAVRWGAPVTLALACLAAANWVRFGNPFELGNPFPASAYVHGPAPTLVSLAGLLVSPGKGLLLFCPVLLLVGSGVRRLWHRDAALTLLLLATVVINLIFFARLKVWSGDYAWGPRFLVIVLPQVFLLAAPAVVAWFASGEPRRFAVVTLALLGVLVNMLALLVSYDRVLNAGSRYHQQQETVSNPGFYFDLANSQLLRHVAAISRMVMGHSEYRVDLWWWALGGVVAVPLFMVTAIAAARLLYLARHASSVGRAALI